MHRIFRMASADLPARLDGAEIIGLPVRFYRRNILGGSVCGLWIGGKKMYDVAVYGEDGEQLGVIGADTPRVNEQYEALRRLLVAEELRTTQPA